MILDLKNLPSGDAILHQIIIDLVEQMTSLQEQLALLKAKSFGKSSEKLNKQIDVSLSTKMGPANCTKMGLLFLKFFSSWLPHFFAFWSYNLTQ